MRVLGALEVAKRDLRAGVVMIFNGVFWHCILALFLIGFLLVIQMFASSAGRSCKCPLDVP